MNGYQDGQSWVWGKSQKPNPTMESTEPIVLVIFNIKSARYLVLFAGKSTR